MKFEIIKEHFRVNVPNTSEKVHTYISIPKIESKKIPIIILIHGFTANGTETHRIFLRLMDLLNSKGLACATFDCRGSGYSDGDFENMTVTNEIKDLNAVISFIRKIKEVHNQKIGILGQSLGGVVAIAGLYKNKYVKTFVFWATPVDFYQNIKEQYGKQWQKNEIICHDKGLYLKRNFLIDLKKYNVTKYISKCTKQKLIIHGSEDIIVPVFNAYKIYDSALAPKKIEIINGGTHGYKNQKKLERKLLNLTSNWFLFNLK